MWSEQKRHQSFSLEITWIASKHTTHGLVINWRDWIKSFLVNLINRQTQKKNVKMARIKSFFGSDLKTGGFIIGYVSLFANILYLILDVEAILVFVLEPSKEKQGIFGSFINEIDTSSVAFPIVLFALVASLYGVIASLLLICGVCTVRVQLHFWPVAHDPTGTNLID